MTQMTDPAGGTYVYSYDGNGNLTGVVYPDSSSKIYWYNESANTGGPTYPLRSPGSPTKARHVMPRFSTSRYHGSPAMVNSPPIPSTRVALIAIVSPTPLEAPQPL